MSAPPVLDRRLLLVSGKGGVGKTTVATVLALLAARRGRTVRLVAVGAPAPALAGIDTATIAGGASLDEYLGRVLPRPVHRRLIRSRYYQRLSAGAPGLFDLMVIGKIADDARGGAWDLVVADVGATGHALQMLGMPAASVEAFGAGRVRREATRIRAELADPRHTALVPVTTPEELAVDEVGELIAGASALGIALGPVVVNRLHMCPRSPVEVPVTPADASPLLAELLRRGRAQAFRAAFDRRALGRLDAVDAIHLPELIGADLEGEGIDLLVAATAAGLDGQPHAEAIPRTQHPGVRS